MEAALIFENNISLYYHIINIFVQMSWLPQLLIITNNKIKIYFQPGANFTEFNIPEKVIK